MKTKSSLFDAKIEGLSKYELVLLVARRAKHINDMRVNLEKKYETRLIEKEKPTLVALNELIDDKLRFKYRRPGEKPAQATPQRGMKKTV